MKLQVNFRISILIAFFFNWYFFIINALFAVSINQQILIIIVQFIRDHFISFRVILFLFIIAKCWQKTRFAYVLERNFKFNRLFYNECCIFLIKSFISSIFAREIILLETYFYANLHIISNSQINLSLANLD